MNQNYIFVAFKKGKKEYTAIVSSWDYEGKDLWLYAFADENGKGANCGYIPNAKVIRTSIAYTHQIFMDSDVRKIIKVWND